MSKIKSILVLSTAAMCLSAAPSFAQYGSGSSYGAKTPTASTQSKVKNITRTISKAEKKQMDALRKKEQMEAQLVKQEKTAQSYGSGTKKGDAMMKKGDAMMEKGDAMMEKGDAMMKKEDAMMKKGDHMMKKEDVMMKEKPASYGSGTKAPSYGSGTTKTPAPAYGSGSQAPAYGSGSAPASGLALNCPRGTTAQPDGTCLITGNFPIG